MMILPPPASMGRADRRSRPRRAADRRAEAETSASTAAPGAEAPGFEGEEPEPAAPVFRARGGGRGRRKTDRQPGQAEDEGGTIARPRPHAPLVAQLIATALNLEQTRVKRRGSVEEAKALYERKAERSKPSRGEF